MSRLAAIGGVAALVVGAAACGTERTFDQGRPPDISPQELGTVTMAPTTTEAPFVPTTAPTTLAPPTQAPQQPQQPAPAATSATTTVDTIPERYTVVGGDTLSGIATKLGVPLDQLLAANNMSPGSLIVPGQQLAVPAGGTPPAQATQPAPTQAATTAFVPTTAATTAPAPTQPPPSTIPERYVVEQGDTLFRVSEKLGVSLQNLLAVNGLQENSTIRPGDELAVPAGGAVPGTSPSPSPTPAPTQPPPAATSATTQAPPPQDPSPGANPPPGERPASPGAVASTTTDASCQAEDSTDADGSTTSFNPGNLIDRDPSTAWRCNVGEDQRVTFNFDGTVTVTSVGLINGYTKDDPETEVDRYLQNHRVRQVRWVFSDGTTVEQDLADNNRGMQTHELAAPVEAEWVRLVVLSTYPPPDDHEFPRPFAAISEVEIIASGG